MPRNPVIENICDRCTRSWYTKADEKPAEVQVKVSYDATGDQPLAADLKCLCEGCQKTVRGLIESITKVMTKSAPVRGAKKAASEDKTPPATSATKPEAPAAPVAGGVPVRGVISSPAPPSVAPSSQHPKR
jgi:hypothetical protein